MLPDKYTAVLQAQDREAFLREIVSFTKRLGFDTIGATVVLDQVGAEPRFVWVDNAPLAYRHIADDFKRGRIDPVSQHCKRASVPIVWDQKTYTSAGLGPLWEEQAPFGYCTGIALALHLPKGLHFFVGVDRKKPLPRRQSEISRMAGELHLFVAHAQDAALRLLLPPMPQETSDPNLTPRELESLRWTMDGKTAWEVGRILGISEQTAVRHVGNATHKLGCVNKHHAVVKALRLGLIR